MSDADDFYDVAKGHGLPHDPLEAIVAPRPIEWISTRDLADYVEVTTMFKMDRPD